MADERLRSSVEAAALVRRAETAGDFAAVLRKGDPDRGALLLIVSSRGRHAACLERMLTLDGNYRWERVGPAESANPADLAAFLARRTRFDDDLWIIELDIASAEQFIAETTLSG